MIKTYKTPWGISIKANDREGTNDENTLISCIIEDEYQIAKLPAGGVAIDLGSHIGASALPLLSKGYRVYTVEMLPDNNTLAKENYRLNNYQYNVKMVEKAISSEDGKMIPAYYITTDTKVGKVHEFIGTTLPRRQSVSWMLKGKELTVETISLETILKPIARVDFMKIDIEASEWKVIRKTSKETLNKINRIAVEIETEDSNPTSTEAFHKILGNQFIDVSKDYFPKWCKPDMIVHGYYLHRRMV